MSGLIPLSCLYRLLERTTPSADTFRSFIDEQNKKCETCTCWMLYSMCCGEAIYGKSAIAPGHDGPPHNPTEKKIEMRKQDRERARGEGCRKREQR